MNYNEYLQNMLYQNYSDNDAYYNNFNNIPIHRSPNMPNNMNTALELIRKSVGDEKEDEAFYEFLISKAPTTEQREIIISIRDDERKHNKMLRKLYFDLTGVNLPVDTYIPEKTLNMTYMQGLEKALMGELAAVTKYQKILKDLTDMNNHNTILEILTDELRHASKYNYLITKNMM